MESPTTRNKMLRFLVYRDHLSSRGFEIPLPWIYRLGWTFAALILFTLAISFLSLRFYWIAKRSSPLRVHDLEFEVSQLRNSLKSTTDALDSQSKTPQTNSLATANVTNGPIAAPVSPAGLPVFIAFQLKNSSPLPDPANLPFQVGGLRAFWRGTNLQVQGNIQYIKGDNGKQEGRIVILARGPETLFTYPDGIMNSAGASSLIDPNQGEFFSVSRFREIKAEFGNLKSKGGLKEVEIFIFSEKISPGQPDTAASHELLVYQKIAVEKTAPAGIRSIKAVPSQSPDQPTQNESAETIEPGADQ